MTPHKWGLFLYRRSFRTGRVLEIPISRHKTSTAALGVAGFKFDGLHEFYRVRRLTAAEKSGARKSSHSP